MLLNIAAPGVHVSHEVGRGGVADDERVGKLPAGEMAATWYVTIVVLLLERSEKTTAS